jgi:hypothetical protein
LRLRTTPYSRILFQSRDRKGADDPPAARYDDKGAGRLRSRYFTQITRQTAHSRARLRPARTEPRPAGSVEPGHRTSTRAQWPCWTCPASSPSPSGLQGCSSEAGEYEFLQVAPRPRPLLALSTRPRLRRPKGLQSSVSIPQHHSKHRAIRAKRFTKYLLRYYDCADDRIGFQENTQYRGRRLL